MLSPQERKFMFIGIVVLVILAAFGGFLIGSAWGEEFDCSKHQDKTWLGQVTNPLDVVVTIELYNNEKLKDTDMIGITAPYFKATLQPNETANVEYQCGENSVIYRIHGTNEFKSLDFHVPNTFLDKDNPNFEYELQGKRTNI